MAIIVQREGEQAKIVSESRFPNEAELQRYVYENPETLPISNIKGGGSVHCPRQGNPCRYGLPSTSWV